MTDQTANFEVRAVRSKSSLKWEYRIYFTLIFLFALPFALGGVILNALGVKYSRRRGGILQRAWAEANAITPMIFMR